MSDVNELRRLQDEINAKFPLGLAPNVFHEAMEAQLAKDDAARKAYIGDSSALTLGEKKTALALSKLSIERSWKPRSARGSYGSSLNDYASMAPVAAYADAPCPDCAGLVRFSVPGYSEFPALADMLFHLRAVCPRCREERRREEALATKPSNTTTVTGSDGREYYVEYYIRASYQTEVEGKFMDVPEARCEATCSLGRCSFSPGHQGDHYAWKDKGDGLTSYSWRGDFAVAPKFKEMKEMMAPSRLKCSGRTELADGRGILCTGDHGHEGAHFNVHMQMKWDADIPWSEEREQQRKTKTPPVPVGGCGVKSLSGRPCVFEYGHKARCIFQSEDASDDSCFGIDDASGAQCILKSRHYGDCRFTAKKPPSDGLCSKEHHGIRCVHAEGHEGYCHTPLGKGFNGPVAEAPPIEDRTGRIAAFGVILDLPTAQAVEVSRRWRRREASDAEYRSELRSRLKEGRDHTVGKRPASLDQRIAESKAARAKR